LETMKFFLAHFNTFWRREVSSANCNGQPVGSFEDRIVRFGGQELYLYNEFTLLL